MPRIALVLGPGPKEGDTAPLVVGVERQVQPEGIVDAADEHMRELGCFSMIRKDFTQNGHRYDLILAVNGYHPLSDYRRALSPDGIYVATGGSMAQTFQAMLLGPIISMIGSKTMGNMLVKPNKDDLVFMKELLEGGKVVPAIDRCYPLSEVAEALRYLGQGHARGKVVITVEHNGE